jgi:hypothetical protein
VLERAAGRFTGPRRCGAAPLRTVDVAEKAGHMVPCVGRIDRSTVGNKTLHEAELGEELHLIEKQMLRGELVAASLVR